MSSENANEIEVCPRPEIIAYVDGELSAREELDLEMHFAACETCTQELNEQKKLLQALDFALEDERELELPENFTKVVVANAESRVSGLRRPKERFNALFICAALFLLVLLGLGSETEALIAASTKFLEQTFAVGSFFGHLIYDFAIGVTVILKSLCFQFVAHSEGSFILLAILLGFSAVLFSRLMTGYKRI